MNRFVLLSVRSFGGACLVLVLSFASAVAAGKFEDRLELLARRRGEARAIRLKMTGTRLLQRGAWNEARNGGIDDYPDQDYKLPAEREFLIDFAGNRVWSVKNAQGPFSDGTTMRVINQYYESFFDGQDYLTHSPTEKNRVVGSADMRPGVDVRLHNEETKKRGPSFQDIERISLFAAGRLPPREEFPALGDVLDLPPPRLMYKDTVTRDGVTCVVVTTEAKPKSDFYDEYWLDPRANVVCYRFMKVNEIRQQLDIKYADPKDRTSPTEYSYREFSPFDAKKLWSSETGRITSVERNPKINDAKFRYTPKFGELITSRSDGKELFWIQGVDVPPMDDPTSAIFALAKLRGKQKAAK